MDVNGTRFHLLLGRGDWGGRCAQPDGTTLESAFNSTEAAFSWDDARHELTLGARLFTFPSAAANQVPRLDERRGAAVDAFGNVYWIGDDRTGIFLRTSSDQQTSQFWSSTADCLPCTTPGAFAAVVTKPPAPLTLSGLTITTDAYLVVGVLEPRGLLVFDLQRGGAPRQLLWPANVAFTPFDMAASADGGLFILDREHSRVWQLDAAIRVVPATGIQAPPFATPPLFTPLEGSATAAADTAPPITEDLTLEVGLSDLVSIEVLRDGSILLMRSHSGDPFSAFRRYRNGQQQGSDLDTSLAATVVDDPSGFTLLGHDFAYVPHRAGVNDPVDDVLYVVGGSGDQAFAFRIVFHDDDSISLEPLREYHPMRLFSGKALVASDSDALYDLRDRWIPLVAQRRTMFATAGEIIVTFDGAEPECTWHRLFLDACIPPECSVRVFSRSANDNALLPAADEYEEPALLLRKSGSEMPWTDDVNDTWELLFQRAKGRFVQLRLVLAGTGRSTPHIRALRAYYPRFSYAGHYLPAVYREDADSAWFLDRFLALMEGFFTTIEERIAAAQCLFDFRCAPADTLEWLAAWFGVALDPAWDERKRRLFIRHAADFFAFRGTVPGLTMALRLVTEECVDDSLFDIATTQERSGVRIVEQFRARAIPNALLDQPADSSGGLPLRTRTSVWQPSQGAADLDTRWATFTGQSDAAFTLDGGSGFADFARATLGFVPQATSSDTPLWQSYLARRYPNIGALNDAYGTSYNAFSDIALPDRPPARPAALTDWIRFETVVLAARAVAHRFTVFLPQGTLGVTDRQARIDLASRVVALEKPAHTTFDVKFYWAWFRLGDARIGQDTVIDRGGNSPDLMAPFVLDRSYIGSGYLAPEPARASRDRILLGASCPRSAGEPQ